MKKENLNLYKETYQDQTINPLELFNISNHKADNIKSFEDMQKRYNHLSSKSQHMQNCQSNLSPKYRTLAQQSLTQESMNDENGLGSKIEKAYSINIEGTSNRANTFLCQLKKKKKDKYPELKKIIHSQKISNIVRNFIFKLRRNNVYSKVVEMESLKEQHSRIRWLDSTGLDINESFQRAFEIILLIVNFLCIYYYTLSLTFDLSQFNWLKFLEKFALIVFLFDFMLNAFTTKRISGKKIIKLKQILCHYLSQSLVIDLAMIIMLIFDIFGQNLVLSYMKLIIILKIPYLLEKMQKIQIHFIGTTYKEQYWSLIKLFFFNFCFAHILALILSSMANINLSQNWMITKNIAHAPWYQIYIWSYYWAINIMLTVGFGDIVATNYQEALCLVFIETFSCMALAYNINCVGSLISNIRAQDLEKSKKYKIFRSLAQKHDISNNLFLKIGNYIEESNNIKKKFNIQEENKFIDNLPKIFKKDYLKQANKSIFQKIYFFSNLAEKAIQSLAQSIQITITHPQELIINTENYMSLKILKEGQMGYCCRKLGSVYNGYVIDKISVSKGQFPILLGVQFITHRRPNYEIKSLEYSIIYGLTYERLIQSLRKSRGDYEYLCFLRDKSKNLIDQFQISKCQNCKTKHTRFLCPRLHFTPIKQQVVNKALYSQKVSRSYRIEMERMKFRKYNPLRNFRSINEIPQEKSLSISTISKNNVFIIKELQNIERINSEISHERTIYDYPLIFLTNAAESIKQELANFLRRENQEDEIWTIALDSMQNYKNYFPHDNPGEIQNKYDRTHKATVFAQGRTENSPFIMYNSQKERLLKQGTYIEKMQYALDSQTYNFTDQFSSIQQI